MHETHERVAVTGCSIGVQDSVQCPKCNRPMTALGSCFGWTEYVCYGDCDAKMMEHDYRAELENGK